MNGISETTFIRKEDITLSVTRYKKISEFVIFLTTTS